MSVQITIRNVPEKVRDELAARAARQGKSMQEYLRQELELMASRPAMDEWLDRVRTRVKSANRRISTKTILHAIHAGRR